MNKTINCIFITEIIIYSMTESQVFIEKPPVRLLTEQTTMSNKFRSETSGDKQCTFIKINNFCTFMTQFSIHYQT